MNNCQYYWQMLALTTNCTSAVTYIYLYIHILTIFNNLLITIKFQVNPYNQIFARPKLIPHNEKHVLDKKNHDK